MEKKNKYAYIVTDEDLNVKIEYKDDPHLTLEELYEKIDCKTIEVVSPLSKEFSDSGLLLVMDEDGKYRNKNTNLIATILFGNPCDYIVGKCVIAINNCDEDEEPDIYAMPTEMAEKIFKTLSNRNKSRSVSRRTEIQTEQN